jgi:hypothetical protein
VRVARVAPGLAAGLRPTRGHVHEFAGMGPCEAGWCYTPGEPVIAVGPSDVVETVNEAATVYDKAGTQLAELDFATFWGPQTQFCTDPRALYVASADRFVISCTDVTESTSPMRFAVSATSDPTGAWHMYAAPNTSFLDQDKVVASADKLVIAGNTSSTELMYVYNLADVVAGVTHPKVVKLTAHHSNVYQAAVEETQTANAYFVSSYPGNKLYLATITGTPAGADVHLTEAVVKSTDFPGPIEPSVPGGSIGGGDIDGRVYDAVFEVESSDSKPVIQYSSARQCGTRDCATSARIDLSGASPVLRANTLIGAPGWDYTYGAVGLDGAGHVFEAYARTSDASAPGAAVAGPGFDVTLQPPAAGTTVCASGDSPPCDERWGDYLGTAIDPSDPGSVWVSGLYQQSDGGYGWGTVIAKVSPSSFELPTVTTGAATKVKATSATIAGSVDPAGVSTTYHFDVGTTTGYDFSTAEQSAGAGTAPLPVSAALTGLDPGTTYHYRLVATTTVGSATGADSTFNTPKPAITTVAFGGTPADPTVTITGKNFGVEPAPDPPTPPDCVAGDTSLDYGANGLWFEDVTNGWTAGQRGDCIGLDVVSYSNTQIVYRFGPFYASFTPVTSGDEFTIMVRGRTFSGTVAYS